MTSAEIFMFEKMAKCNCNRNLEAIFVCLKNEQECKDSKDQKYYCVECSQEDKHDHKSITIVNELKAQNKKWTTLFNEISTTFFSADAIFKELSPLIAYLEEAMMQPGIAINRPVKWLTADYNSLKALNDSVTTLYNG